VVVSTFHVRFILFSPAKCQALICHHFEYADRKFFFREFSPEFFQKSFFWFLVTLPSVSVSKILEEWQPPSVPLSMVMVRNGFLSWIFLFLFFSDEIFFGKKIAMVFEIESLACS